MNENKVTPEAVGAAIQSIQHYVFPGSKTTICLLTMDNGHEVVGSSACVDPANFLKDVGEFWSLEDARRQVARHLGFRLQDVLHGQREG